MILVEIISGPQVGQVNLVPLKPEQLWLLAEHGWRWEVDWKTVADHEAFAWGRTDLVMKVLSALMRGGEVRFIDQVWRAKTTHMAQVIVVAQQVEDYVSEAGFNVMAGEDTEEYFVINVRSAERLDG